jgi:hypothetical protein
MNIERYFEGMIIVSALFFLKEIASGLQPINKQSYEYFYWIGIIITGLYCAFNIYNK